MSKLLCFGWNKWSELGVRCRDCAVGSYQKRASAVVGESEFLTDFLGLVAADAEAVADAVGLGDGYTQVAVVIKIHVDEPDVFVGQMLVGFGADAAFGVG